jgi:hypothetical protein
VVQPERGGNAMNSTMTETPPVADLCAFYDVCARRNHRPSL